MNPIFLLIKKALKVKTTSTDVFVFGNVILFFNINSLFQILFHIKGGLIVNVNNDNRSFLLIKFSL